VVLTIECVAVFGAEEVVVGGQSESECPGSAFVCVRVCVFEGGRGVRTIDKNTHLTATC
jgi:hypothetical protein